ncbi:hypothetical protein [uncultured Gimesia sp.]|uniref:hypothetical protein n=1 Tax=uncultured Gimesia sp. TaxID=1678688 RepID=UPI0030D7BC26
MAWPEISIEDFPPQRDDEPSSLRQDIIDELSDHFACALNRELLKNLDAQIAKQRVINQFGDPIKIACQLWLDAMKEKIMSQRIMTGVSAVMAVCCLAVVGISWMLFQESQSMNQKMLAQVAAMTTMDPQFLKQMEMLLEKQATQANDSSEEMNPILFQLVEENKEGSPATGFKGTLTKYEGKNVIYTVDAVSDKNGLLVFGKLPWGNYEMNLHAPWNNEKLNTLNITTIPGRKFEETIICPAGVPEKVPVEFQIEWQGKPAEEEMFLISDFRHINDYYGSKHRQYNLSTRRTIQNHTWSYRHNLTIAAERSVYLIDVKNNQAISCPVKEDGNFEDLEFQDLIWKSSVEALQGEYLSPTIYLIRKSELSKLAELNSISTIGLIRTDRSGMDLMKYAYPSMGMYISPFEKFKVEPQLLKTLEKKDSQAAEMLNAFEPYQLMVHPKARKDQLNVWKIIVPALDPITQESGSLSSAL